LTSKQTDSLNGIKDLIKKEKQLHKDIRKDYKKITEKINLDFDQIQKSRIKSN